MIQIRCGDRWRHDSALLARLRRAAGPARAAAAKAVVDALALEVDGVDISRGLAEGPLLPSLEALLRAIAKVVAGGGHATARLPDGEIEIVLRRRGPSVLLTIVSVASPSQVLARDVEVEIEELAAAAIEASADLCRDLALVLPGLAARGARSLRAAARDLRRTEARTPPRRGPSPPAREPRDVRGEGRVAIGLAISDEDGLLASYEGGRADLGSLLVPGRLSLRSAAGEEIASFPGFPFLVLRDLGARSERILSAAARGEPRHEIPLSRAGTGSARIVLDLAAGRLLVPGRPAVPCTALAFVRAVSGASLELGRVARARNPRQAENAYLADLEAGAADRLAQIEEIARGDLSLAPAAAPRLSGRIRGPGALGPHRLRRLAFRRTWSLDVGMPAGGGLFLAGGVAILAGEAAIAGVERSSGATLWRREGARFAAALPGAALVSSEGILSALAPRTGRLLFRRHLPGGAPSAAVALPRGPFVLVEAGALTALDPSSGRTLWRMEPPGATRITASAAPGLAIAACDTGALYGIDATGRTVWRLRARGPLVRAPVVAPGICLAVASAGPGAALLAVEASTGARLWEASLDLLPSCDPVAWGRRVAVAGSVADDAVISVLDGSGAPVWTVVPPVLGRGPPSLAPGPCLVVRDPAGAVSAIGRDGRSRWTLPPLGHGHAGSAPPALSRGTIVTPVGDGIAALDARSGEILGTLPGAAPSRMALDRSLGLAAMDLDGVATGWSLATHLSVV